MQNILETPWCHTGWSQEQKHYNFSSRNISVWILMMIIFCCTVTLTDAWQVWAVCKKVRLKGTSCEAVGWPEHVENVQIFHLQGLYCFSVDIREKYIFALNVELLKRRLCWFTRYQWRRQEHQLVMWLTLSPTMLMTSHTRLLNTQWHCSQPCTHNIQILFFHKLDTNQLKNCCEVTVHSIAIDRACDSWSLRALLEDKFLSGNKSFCCSQPLSLKGDTKPRRLGLKGDTKPRRKLDWKQKMYKYFHWQAL